MADGSGVHYQALDLEGVLDEILARLPVKALMRFRCVCKSWRALISQSHFVTKHFNNNTPTTSSLLVLMIPYKSRDRETPKYLSVDCEALKDLNDDAHLAVRELQFPVRFPISSCKEIVGSCNGLICLQMAGEDMVLWNPCTGESNLLPKPNADFFISSFYGFGYDSTNDDYKVMKGFSVRAQRGVRCMESERKTVVEVFSLKSGLWRTHENLSYYRIVERGCLLNGALHWSGTIFSDNGSTEAKIVSFDLAAERFQVMLPYPSQAGFRYKFIDGYCLGLYNRTAQNETFRFRIWMMKEYGVQGSWTEVGSLHISHDSQFSLATPLCILGDGEGLIGATRSESLALYSFKEHTFRNVIRTCKWYFDAVFYRESLLSPITCGIAGI